MLTFPTNLTNFILRLLLLFILFFIEYLFFNLGLKVPGIEKAMFRINAIHLEFKLIYFMYCLILMVFFFALTIVSSLLAINKIEVDTNTDSITFIRLFSKQALSTSDISKYFDTVHKNNFRSWTGILIKTNDNKTIQVTGQNIKSLSDLKNYLSERKIFCGGQRKMIFPFN